MGSFNVNAQSYVPGVKTKAFGPAKDGSWLIHVARTNFAEEADLGQIATVFLVPAEIVDRTKPTARNVAVIPESCSGVQVSVGPCTLITADSHDLLGLEVRSTEKTGDNSDLQEIFIIGRR